MADRPIRCERRKLAEFDDRGSGIGVHQSGAKILASFESVGVQAFHFAVFTDSGNKVTLFAINSTEVIMRLWLVRVEHNRFLVLRDRTIDVTVVRQKNP